MLRLVGGRQDGVSLIELMIGIGISAILAMGVATVMARITISGAESVEVSRLNQQLRGNLDFITRELQRAGYVNWFASWDNFDKTSNPETNDADGNNGNGNNLLDDDVDGDGFADIRDFYLAAIPAINLFGRVELYSFPTPGDPGSGTAAACESNCDCVLYSYDINEDGFQGVSSGAGAFQNTDNFELFAMRWNKSEGSLEMRRSGAHNCSSAGWENITDENVVNITDARFELVYLDVDDFDSDGFLEADTDGDGVKDAGCDPLDPNDLTIINCDATTYKMSGAGGQGPSDTSCLANAGKDLPGAADTVCLQRRKIAITLTAELVSNPEITLSLNSSVKIKNDHYQPE